MKVQGILAAAAFAAIATVSQAALVAYNDFNYTGSGSGGGANAANVTSINANGNGTLLDQATGASMGTLTMSNMNAATGLGSTPTSWPAGGEANAVFAGIVNNAAGYTYNFATYSSSLPGLFALSGLDTTKTYDIVFACYPGNQPTNTTVFTITGAQSFTNASTSGIGTRNAPNDQVTIIQTGTTVAHFSNIVPTGTGNSGTFAITMTEDPTTPTTARVNAMRLTADSVPEPVSFGLLGLSGLALLKRRRA